MEIIVSWTGIVFLVVLGWDGSAVEFGVDDEHFKTEKLGWEYYRGLPTFEDFTTQQQANFYDSRAGIRFFKVQGVGNAWVTCKPTNSPQEVEDAN